MHKYATLKEWFVETFWPSKQEVAPKILDEEGLGDSKLAKLIDRMLH